MRTRVVLLALFVAATALGGCGARSGLLSIEVTDGATLPDAGQEVLVADAIATDLGVDASFDCPKDPPTTTDACAVVGAVCSYRRGKIGPCGDATTSDQLAYRCERDGWLEIARCIDPSACPATPPIDGTACAQSGLDCFYPSATCSTGAIAQCDTGVWLGVNDCGARPKAGPCVPSPTLVGDARVLLDGKGTIADRAALATAGTQLFATWVVTPELGGTETIASSVVQTAVPSMARPLPFEFTGSLAGDTMAAADFARDRFAVGWGSSETATAGAWTWTPLLDGSAAANHVSARPSREVDVATTSAPDGRSYGWFVHRHPLGDFKSGMGTSAIPIDADGAPRSEEVPLADERPTAPDFEPLHHAWAAVSKWRRGFAIAASMGGTSSSDPGINLWLVPDPTSASLPKPILLRVGQALSGDVVGLSNGDVIVAYMPEAGTARAPYALVRVTPDGSTFAIPSADLGVATSPSPPRLAPFDDGFVLVFSAVRDADPDFVPGMLTVSLRSATGEMIVDPVIEGAENLRGDDPIPVAFSVADRALHVAWTQSVGGTVRVMRQRFVCRGGISEPGG